MVIMLLLLDIEYSPCVCDHSNEISRGKGFLIFIENTVWDTVELDLEPLSGLYDLPRLPDIDIHTLRFRLHAIHEIARNEVGEYRTEYDEDDGLHNREITLSCIPDIECDDGTRECE